MPISPDGNHPHDLQCVEITCPHWGGDNLCLAHLENGVCPFDLDIVDPEEEWDLEEEWETLP